MQGSVCDPAAPARPVRPPQTVSRVAAFALAVGVLFVATSTLLWRLVLDLTSFGPPIPAAAEPGDSRSETVSIGAVSRLSRSSLYHGYQPVLDYLSRATRYRFRLRPASSYREAVADLVAGRTRAAFFGGLLYVEARAEFGVVPLVRPRNASGGAESESVVVVRDDSSIRDLAGLRGRSVAVPPADTLSARWLGSEGAGDLSFTLRTFANHQAVAHQVLRGVCDAGVLKERVALDYLARGLRVVARSGPFPSAPLVAAPDTDPALTRAVVDSLVRLDPRRPQDRAVLSTFDAEFSSGFVPARDSDYEPIRALLARSGGPP